LYFFFALSLTNLYFFAVTAGDGIYAAIFILVGYLTTFFSKNMIVIMCLALIISNVLKYGSNIRVRDGFTDATGGEVGDDKVEIEVLSKDNEVVSTSITQEGEGTLDLAAGIDAKVDIMKSIETTQKLDSETKKDLRKLVELQSQLLSEVSVMNPLIKEAQSIMAKLSEKTNTKLPAMAAIPTLPKAPATQAPTSGPTSSPTSTQAPSTQAPTSSPTPAPVTQAPTQAP